MKVKRASLVVLAVAALLVTIGPGAADEKPKEKAKAKPPARSYSDEDLKKYQDKPQEGTDTSAGSTAEPSSSSSTSTDEAAPRRRQSREYGGYQEVPPERPSKPKAPDPATPAAASAEPAAPSTDDAASPEEADWRARAKQAQAPVREAEGRIAQIESQIAELRDKLNPMSTKYVLGGNSTAGAGAIYEVEEEIRTLDGELVYARTARVEAEKGFQAFLEEARAAGASPAWLNP